MKRWARRAFVWRLPLLLGILTIAARGAETGPPSFLEFLDGRSREIIDNVYEDIRSVAISEATFQAELISVGKAPPLSATLLARLKAKDRSLYQKAKGVESAVKLEQDKKVFYLRIFEPLPGPDELRGHAHPVKCHVVVLSIRTGDRLVHIPLIKTLRPLPAP
jgi:hypothetical protein